jgi:hypothetical protein
VALDAALVVQGESLQRPVQLLKTAVQALVQRSALPEQALQEMFPQLQLSQVLLGRQTRLKPA